MVNEFTDKLTHHVFLKTASDIIGPNCENFKSLSLIFHPDKFTNNKFKQQATQFWHDLNNLYTNTSSAVVRLYSKALSSTEVLQNFNFYRSRYGI